MDFKDNKYVVSDISNKKETNEQKNAFNLYNKILEAT